MRLVRSAVLMASIAVFIVLPATAADAPLTNADVVKLVRAGLGDEVVIAKIRQAEASFELGTEALLSLKAAGVSQPVIAAMLERATPMPVPVVAAAAAPAIPGLEITAVRLATTDGEVPLDLVRGEIGSSSFIGFGAYFANFPGTAARVRTKDTGAALLVTSPTPPANRIFIGKLDVDDDDGVRSLRLMTQRGMLTRSQDYMNPDEDWTVPYDVTAAGDGLWRLTPRARLEPGQYGLYVDESVGMPGAGVFGFGVE